LRHFGLNDGGKYAHSEAAGHAVDVFKACLKLPITLKQNQRLKAPHCSRWCVTSADCVWSTDHDQRAAVGERRIRTKHFRNPCVSLQQA
jgi:hypothetical protein